MDKPSKADLARGAQFLLAEPTVKEAFAQLRTETLEAIERSVPEAAEEREGFYRDLRALERLKNRLTAMKTDGEAAALRMRTRSIAS